MANWLIIGGTGRVGRHLVKRLAMRGEHVIVSSRSIPLDQSEWVQGVEFVHSGDQDTGKPFLDAWEKSDVVVNLVGEDIAQKWTPKSKKEITDSRVNSTKMISFLYKSLKKNPKTWINASAVGYYGSTGEAANEESESGDNWLAEVCRAWESEVKAPDGVKTITLRIGPVLQKEAGPFPKMNLPYLAGFGAWLGSGKQFFPWIHVDDVVNSIIFLEKNTESSDVFNLVSPEAITQKDFCIALNEAYGRPRWQMQPPIASIIVGQIVKMALGNMASLLLEGREVSSQKIIDAGYKFKYPTALRACKSLLAK